MRNKILAAFVAASTLCFIALILYRGAHPPVRKSNFDSAVVRRWSAMEFRKIEANPSFQKSVELVPIEGSNLLTQLQHDNLLSSVYDTFIGLKSGSYNRYRQFRTPTPAHLNPKLFNQEHLKMLLKGAKPLMHPGEQVPTNFEDYVRVMTSRMNGDYGLTNYWVGACVTNASITVQQSTNLPADLLTIAREHENQGLFRPPLFFIPDHNEDDVLHETGKLTTAVLTVVIQHKLPDPPFRVYIRYFWDNKYRCWVPGKYVSSFSEKTKWNMIW